MGKRTQASRPNLGLAMGFSGRPCDVGRPLAREAMTSEVVGKALRARRFLRTIRANAKKQENR